MSSLQEKKRKKHNWKPKKGQEAEKQNKTKNSKSPRNKCIKFLDW